MARTIHGVTWNDDLEWMESMRGNTWNSFIKNQQKRWVSELEPLRDEITLITSELDRRVSSPMFRAGAATVSYEPYNIQWKFPGSYTHKSADLDRRGKYIWSIEEVGGGAEVYAVRLWKEGVAKPIWEKRGVAPFVAVVGGRCYCLEAKNTLVFWRLVSWDAMTGRGFKIHYEEMDYRYNLELIRGDEKHAYLRRQSGEKQDAFLIERDSPRRISVLEGISLDSRRFVFGSNAEEYLVWQGKWEVSSRLLGWRFPSWLRAVPEILDTRNGYLITKWHGCRTFWEISRTSAPRPMWRGWGQIMIDPWDSPWIRLVQPGMETIWWNRANLPSLPPVSKCHVAKSADGTSVPFIIVPSTGKAKGLLVIGYGAYGIPTNLMTQRWEPLIKRGWALAIGLWRGGGDHTPEWEDAGRRDGRILVLEDAEAVVRAARKITGVSAKKTVIYGRSAGGLWVGGLSAKYPTGDLAGGAYMEVPYLDVLRTVTNRSLPLTDIETDEFGLPEQRLSDLLSVTQWSPMEMIPTAGIPGVWQIVRTGLNDSEVLAYESAKWIQRNRNKHSFLAVEGDQGHFISGNTGRGQQAQDLAKILKNLRI